MSLGMTMIEILVVLAIMAIGAAFVVPMVSGQGATTGELKSAARQIAAGLRLARSEAVTSRRETALTLDLEARSFHVANDAREVALPRKVDLELFTAQSDLVSDKRGAIRFFPDGGSNGGRVTVSSGERRYEVDVDWLTGRVAILDQ
ncbi:MAG: type II secretion system protein GspH [Betaproteobacteria bacterium PRO3]|nr:type II secretion system protein GspH [Betaproteobacteria bacterium PRO3]